MIGIRVLTARADVADEVDQQQIIFGRRFSFLSLLDGSDSSGLMPAFAQ
jgi:hypothetical protein